MKWIPLSKKQPDFDEFCIFSDKLGSVPFWVGKLREVSKTKEGMSFLTDVGVGELMPATHYIKPTKSE